MEREEPATQAPQKRRGATRRVTPSPAPPSKVALQLKLEPGVKLWLETNALGRSMTVSQLVTDLVASQPAGWTLHRPRQSTASEPTAD